MTYKQRDLHLYKEHRYHRASIREQALRAQRDDLVVDLDTALDLLHDKEDTIAQWKELAEQQHLSLVAMRKTLPASCR